MRCTQIDRETEAKVRKNEINRSLVREGEREELSEKERKRKKESKTNHEILDFLPSVFIKVGNIDIKHMYNPHSPYLIQDTVTIS